MLYDLVETAMEWMANEDDRIDNTDGESEGAAVLHQQSSRLQGLTKANVSPLAAGEWTLFHNGRAVRLETLQSSENSQDSTAVKAAILPVECWLAILSFLPNTEDMFCVGQAALCWNVELAVLALLNPVGTKPATKADATATKGWRHFPRGLRDAVDTYKNVSEGFFARRRLVDAEHLFSKGCAHIQSAVLVGAVGKDRVSKSNKTFHFLPSNVAGETRLVSGMSDVFQYLERKHLLGIWKCRKSQHFAQQEYTVSQALDLPSMLRDSRVDPSGSLVSCLCDDGEFVLFRESTEMSSGFQQVLNTHIPLDSRRKNSKFISCLTAGSRAVLSSNKNALAVMDLETGQFIHSTELLKTIESVPDQISQISPHSLLVGFADGYLRVLDLRLSDSKQYSWSTLVDGSKTSTKYKPAIVVNPTVVAFCEPSPGLVKIVNPWNMHSSSPKVQHTSKRPVLSMSSLDSLILTGHADGASLWDARKPEETLSSHCLSSPAGTFVALDSCKYMVAGTSFLGGGGAVQFSSHDGSSSSIWETKSEFSEFEFGLDEFSFATCNREGKDVHVQWMQRKSQALARREIQDAVAQQEHSKNLVRDRARRVRQDAKAWREKKNLGKSTTSNDS